MIEHIIKKAENELFGSRRNYLIYRIIFRFNSHPKLDAKFYAHSASFDKFSNKGKTLVVQFSVQHQQKIDCGGGYVKVSIF